MTEIEPALALRAFERRLGLALGAYAAAIPTDVDAIVLTRRIAHQQPHQSIAERALRRLGAWPRMARWALVAALLAFATVVAVIIAGAIHRDPFVVETDGPTVTLQLFGEWVAAIPEADPAEIAGDFAIDFRAATLLAGPDGPLDAVGRAVEIERTGFRTARVRIESGSTCGDGTYVIEERPADLRLTKVTDGCAARVAILERTWKRQYDVPLVVGMRYSSAHFSEPFHFILPETVPGSTNPHIHPMEEPGVLRLGSGFSWQGRLLDDVHVVDDLCAQRGPVREIPATPAAVGEWLRANPRLVLAEPVRLTVDGRTAVRFDYACPRAVPPKISEGVTGGGNAGRVYAIPTDDDLILFFATRWGGPESEVVKATDAFVRSITFD